MPKWSIRVPTETADAYRDFCDKAGISLQGALEATVRYTVAQFESNGRRPPEEWFSEVPEVRAAWLAHVRIARELDAEKRARS